MSIKRLKGSAPEDDPYMEPDFEKGETYYTTSLRKKAYRRSNDNFGAPVVLGDRVAQIRVLLTAGASISSLAQRYGMSEAQIRAEVAKG